MANIYDVARRAKVSVSTVSAVINDSAYVSPLLRTRVKKAVAELVYKPNLLARSLATQQSRTLGMIVPDISNPFWPAVVRGAEDRAHAAGYTLLISNSDDDPCKQELYLNLFLAKRVDGILLAKAPGPLNGDAGQQIASGKICVVQMLRVDTKWTGDAVLLDDEDAAYEAVAHLLRLDYRRIGILSGPQNIQTAARRLAGYRRALRDAGVKIDRTLQYEGDFRLRSGTEGGLVLLKKKPEAVFVANYLMAVGFMMAVRQYRLRCPQDVALVTCDDHPWMEAFTPRLTTVNFPKYELGAEAARVLLERIGCRDRPPQRVQLRSALCVRESCGALLQEPVH
ncbi:MAG: LacI family DNA-binding transcriptional regulator [Vicinamibacterales bacterium]